MELDGVVVYNGPDNAANKHRNTSLRFESRLESIGNKVDDNADGTPQPYCQIFPTWTSFDSIDSDDNGIVKPGKKQQSINKWIKKRASGIENKEPYHHSSRTTDVDESAAEGEDDVMVDGDKSSCEARTDEEGEVNVEEEELEDASVVTEMGVAWDGADEVSGGEDEPDVESDTVVEDDVESAAVVTSDVDVSGDGAVEDEMESAVAALVSALETSDSSSFSDFISSWTWSFRVWWGSCDCPSIKSKCERSGVSTTSFASSVILELFSVCNTLLWSVDLFCKWIFSASLLPCSLGGWSFSCCCWCCGCWTSSEKLSSVASWSMSTSARENDEEEEDDAASNDEASACVDGVSATSAVWGKVVDGDDGSPDSDNGAAAAGDDDEDVTDVSEREDSGVGDEVEEEGDNDDDDDEVGSDNDDGTEDGTDCWTVDDVLAASSGTSKATDNAFCFKINESCFFLNCFCFNKSFFCFSFKIWSFIFGIGPPHIKETLNECKGCSFKIKKICVRIRKQFNRMYCFSSNKEVNKDETEADVADDDEDVVDFWVVNRWIEWIIWCNVNVNCLISVPKFEGFVAKRFRKNGNVKYCWMSSFVLGKVNNLDQKMESKGGKFFVNSKLFINDNCTWEEWSWPISIYDILVLVVVVIGFAWL